MTRRLALEPYGSQRSTISGCGLLGIGGRRSITTFLGGGGNCLPDMVISLRPTSGGCLGGISRITKLLHNWLFYFRKKVYIFLKF
jgi:hypothetical protein